MIVPTVMVAPAGVWHIPDDWRERDVWRGGRETLCGLNITRGALREDVDTDHPRVCRRCLRLIDPGDGGSRSPVPVVGAGSGGAAVAAEGGA